MGSCVIRIMMERGWCKKVRGIFEALFDENKSVRGVHFHDDLS